MKQLISRRQFISALGAAAAVGAVSSVAPVSASACLPFFDHIRRTPCGYIRGVAAKAPGVTAYKGIRYAEAGRWEYPRQVTEAGRWEYPRQVTHWNGIYDASEFGPCAMQENAITPEWKNGRDQFYYREFREGLDYTYSEDCQYLNIWAPDDAKNAPVIVYIHGGAFLSGSGWDKVFDEPVWPSHGVIGVTLNYRLSVFGYACLPELAAEAGHTGNYGLYDQLCALQWVRDNIAAFGGDPDNITLMGQSAGAKSVQMLSSTHATEGLVRQVVMSSGAGDESSLFAGEENMEAKYDFWKVWKEATGAATLEELRALSSEEVLAAMGALFAHPDYGYMGVMNNLGPVWDNALFPNDGFTLPVPYLCGGNTEDQVTGLALDALNWCEKQPVNSYAYCFARQLPGDEKGAFHSADLWYWFGTLENCWRPFTEEDQALSDTMVGYLTNFARTGDPNGDGLPVWETAQSSGQSLWLDTSELVMADVDEEV